MDTRAAWNRFRTHRVRSVLVIASLLIAGTVTIFGTRSLLAFDNTPGLESAAPGIWPAASTIPRSGNRPELLIFVHPFCSCSSATLNELAKVLAHPEPKAVRPGIHVLFDRPKGSGWSPSALWKEAQSLPGVNVQWDEEFESRRFGALTSGYVLLYSSAGRLLFHGGITGSRGHQGDNYGSAQLVRSLSSGEQAGRASFVFGCSLGRTGA